MGAHEITCVTFSVKHKKLTYKKNIGYYLTNDDCFVEINIYNESDRKTSKMSHTVQCYSKQSGKLSTIYDFIVHLLQFGLMLIWTFLIKTIQEHEGMLVIVGYIV